MATRLSIGLLSLALLGGAGCFSPRGVLFTYTTMPYELPTDQTVRGASKRCVVDITQIKEPFTRAGLSVMWTSQAVMEAAGRAGMTELRYADLQTLSIANGTYLRQRLIFYGE